MDTSKKWFDFMKSAHDILLKGQPIDQYQSRIQLLFEPSFDNSFHLQLEINDQVVKWYRTKWLRLVDAQAYYDKAEESQYTGQLQQPTIIFESGSTEINRIQPVLDVIKSISIRPITEKWGGIILDGIYYTLLIGVDHTETTFRWHYRPDEWKDLEKLAAMLIELNDKL